MNKTARLFCSWPRRWPTGEAFSPTSLRHFSRKRIHNRRPSCVDPFEDESSIFDGTVHEKSLRHVRLVRIQVDELPRSQNRCGKQNGELPFFGHWESPQIDLNAGRGRSSDSTSAFPEMPESAPHDQFTCSGKELQPDSKCFGTETLTINYSRPSPQVT